MILCNTQILSLREKGEITIEPFHAQFVNPNSYDVHLGREILMCESELIDPFAPLKWSKLTIPQIGAVFYPNVLYLGVTVERIGSSSPYLVPSLHGKSSIGRCGIEPHICARFGDIGFVGFWTLEIRVTQPTRLYPFMPIGQISWQEVSGDVSGDYSQVGNYANQPAEPVPSSMWQRKTPKDFINIFHPMP